MSHAEFLSWVEFYKRWPFDDAHRFHRPAALVARSLGGGDVEKYMDWLQPPEADGMTSADRDLFRAMGVKR